MADYLVLEEDGTSHLELEESTSDLLLEDGPVFAANPGSFVVGAPSAVLSGEFVPGHGPATWKVGTITVPGSTGSASVTGLGGTPAAVFFFGANWLTEDTAVTSTGTAVFRGMAAPKWDAPGTLVQSAATVGPAGDQCAVLDVAIVCHSTAGSATDLYRASLSSLDADGFTLNWEVAASGGYKVVYAALMNVVNVGAYKGVSATIGLGWKAGACLLHGAWTGSSSLSFGANDRTQMFYGGGAYPGTNDFSWYGAGLTAYTFPTSASQQYNIGIYNQAPGTVIAQSGSFIGPFLSAQNVTGQPTGTNLQDFTFETHLSSGSNTNPGMLVMWDDSDSITGRLTPGAATGNTATVSGLPFAPGLVIGYSISDEPQQQGTGGRGAVGFSVVADGFQWTALVDGVSSRGAFQSFQRGVCDAVNGTSVHAGTVTLTADGFVVTTEEDDTTAQSWVWHAFGHPERLVAWIPKIARWMVGP